MPHPPASPGTSPSFSRALASLARSLLLRPLLWLCATALLGVVIGGKCAQAWQNLSRDQAALWYLLPFLLFGLGTAWHFRRSPWFSRLGIALAVTTCFTGYTARRLLPPADDISRAFVSSQRDRPLHTSPIRITGIIGDYPRRSRWNVRFPLDVETASGNETAGRVWITAPFDERLEIGDRLELRTDLRPLHHPDNPGERETFWSALGAHCWCENGPLIELHLLTPGSTYPLERRIQGVRRALLARYETLFVGDEDTLVKHPFPHQNAALLTAMVWGESGLSEPLPQQTRDDFRAAGLSHLLVSSGTHVRTTVTTYQRPKSRVVT